MALELRGITKRFPGVLANDDVSLSVAPGEVLALLGENGAGKSTLMNILYGLYRPDEGTVMLDGEPLELASTHDAIAAGIGMVHQHFMLVPVFTVAENVILGQEPVGTAGIIDLDAARAAVRETSEMCGFHVDPDAVIEDLPVGVQQRVEIIKVLNREARYVVFDEPTAVLTPQEVVEFFTILRILQQDGKGIIFITHKLGEALEVADRIVVMRTGRKVGEVLPADTDEERLAEMMVGRPVELVVPKDTSQPGASVLQVKDLVVLDDRGHRAVDGATFEVKVGEIVGVAGVQGNGQTELIEAIMGLRATLEGAVSLDGVDVIDYSPRQLHKAGVSHIPEDRQESGLVLGFTVAENMVLDSYYEDPFSRGLFMDWDDVNETAARLVKQYDVRTPGIHVPVSTLSGGNQQKVIVAREFDREVRLVIASQPTRGIDVGSIEYIHTQIVAMRDAGAAVLVVSSELEEVTALADRVLVLYHGRIAGEFPPDADITEIGLAMLRIGPMTQAPPIEPDAPPPEQPSAMNTATGTGSSMLRSLVVPTLALVSALIIGALIIALSDVNNLPLLFSDPGTALGNMWSEIGTAYSALFRGAVGSIYALSETLFASTPLILASLGIALAFRAGLFNIGAQGQMLIGGITAAWVGIHLSLPGPIHLVVALLAGVIGGMVWGGIAGLLKAKTGAHEVITTIMFNFIALYLVQWLLSIPLFQETGSNNPVSEPLRPSAHLPALFGSTYRVTFGFLIAVAAVFAVQWLLFRSSLGFEFRAVGLNPAAGAYAGMGVATLVTLAMALAGGLAGVAGANQVMALPPYQASPAMAATVGFDAITVALLGRSHPIGVLWASLLFGALKAGGREMQGAAQIPLDLVVVLQALIVIFVAAPALIRAVWRVKTPPPRPQLSKGWGA